MTWVRKPRSLKRLKTKGKTAEKRRAHELWFYKRSREARKAGGDDPWPALHGSDAANGTANGTVSDGSDPSGFQRVAGRAKQGG